MFSTIDVMVAQAHIDQLNELADAKHLVKADRHCANSGFAGVQRKSADPRGLRTFCIPSQAGSTTPLPSARPTHRRRGHTTVGGPGRGAHGQRSATYSRGHHEARQRCWVRLRRQRAWH